MITFTVFNEDRPKRFRVFIIKKNFYNLPLFCLYFLRLPIIKRNSATKNLLRIVFYTIFAIFFHIVYV